MDFTLENLEQAVLRFYHTDASTQAQAHQWLTAAQTSPNAWCFVWELLQPTKTPEVQFFAATTLHMKVMKNWSEVPVEQYEDLKKRLLQAIINYATGPKIVLNRLCIALSAFILHTTPKYWPGAIPELLGTLQPTNLPSVPPDKALWILLEVLTVIPEEFQSMQMTQNQKVNARLELERSIPQVVGLIDSVLSESKDSQLVSQAVRCVSAWLQLGIPIIECDNLISRLVQTVTTSHSNTQLVEWVLEALSHMVNHPTSHKYPAAVLNFISRVLPIYDLVVHHADKPDLISSVYGLFVSMGESHPRLILHSLLTEARDSCLQLINIILSCSNAAGHYPTHESYSYLGFGFWYILQDELIACDMDKHQELMPLIVPVYTNLAAVLVHKAEFPPDNMSISTEDKEAFRCYRQDIADTMMYCYNVLREPLLVLLLDRLQTCLVSEAGWQPLEATLHGVLSVAESVSVAEDRHLPQFFAALPSIPFNKLNIRVAITTLDVIGAYAEWMNCHPTTLQQVIPLLMFGLESSDTAPSATMSLKDITRDCQLLLEPHSHLILTRAMEVLRAGTLKQNESVRLMYSVGRVLSILPLQTIIQYLDNVMLPCVDELQLLLNQPDSAEVKAALLLRLKMLSMICNSLDTQAVAGHTASGGSGDTAIVPMEQPVYLVLEKVLPTLTAIVNKWQQDPCIIQAVCCVLKHAISTLLECCTPLVPAVTELLAASYRLHPHSSPLEVIRQLCLLFGREGSPHQPLVQSLLTVTVRNTLELPITEHTDVAEAFMQLCANLIKKNPSLLICPQDIDMTELLTFAIAVLGQPELPTVKAASVFLTNLIGLSREQPKLLTAVQSTGEQLVHRILRNIGGESPRGCIDPLADLLLILNKKYCDNLSRWLYQTISINGFPSPKASVDNKQHFVKSVLKERANKRKVQEIIQEFSLICRGLVGTEYAAQLKAQHL
ncbi:importin-13 [Macrosteles quadrilineatus]|uniref:importin-13 n=1 Tax=Macrosteles quadrilineatus TaxID=74068 RepID=UPI0023E25CB1|nr:importin-13 [Macrosteles quadrilineatus]